MRLICPNCGAQYEVGEGTIPDAGRDVQCSNCGHTWFEQPGASEAAEQAGFAAPDPIREPHAEPVREPAQTNAPEPIRDPAPKPQPERDPTPPLRKRELAPDVADILREEAKFEQSARQLDADPIETQPDLGLAQDTDEDRRRREASDRLARLRGEAEDTAGHGAGVVHESSAPRRELLPDIEEINSSLRHETAPQAATTIKGDQPRRRSRFRQGFIISVVIALLALAAYVFAPQISAALPQAEPALTNYVEWVDGLRLWLSATVQDLIEASPIAAPDSPASEN